MNIHQKPDELPCNLGKLCIQINLDVDGHGPPFGQLTQCIFPQSKQNKNKQDLTSVW